MKYFVVCLLSALALMPIGSAAQSSGFTYQGMLTFALAGGRRSRSAIHGRLAGFEIGLDWNYPTYVVPGTSETSTITIPAGNRAIYSQANIGPITLIPNRDTKWNLGSNGNVRADSGVRVPERGVRLATVPRMTNNAAPVWVEIK